MTHANNFTIPAQLDFKPTTTFWRLGVASLTGWVAETPPRLIKPIGIREGAERVHVALSFPYSTSGMLGYLEPVEYEIEMYRDGLPPGLILPHESKRYCPDFSDRSFPVLVCPRPESTILKFNDSGPSGRRKNAWAMRDELLHLPDDPSKLTAFLNRWGFWLSGSYFDFSSLNNSCPFAVVFPHELYEAREMYRRALIGT